MLLRIFEQREPGQPQPTETLAIVDTDSPSTAHDYSINLSGSGNEWEILSGNSIIALNDSMLGDYQVIGYLDTFKVELACDTKTPGKVGTSERRVSTRMSHDEERILNQISLEQGALWGNNPTWRKLLRGLADGSISF